MGSTARGNTDLAKYRAGQTLTMRRAILAKCSDCCCEYVDGKKDCEVPMCPLYPFMPYRTTPPEKKKATGRGDALRRWREQRGVAQ